MERDTLNHLAFSMYISTLFPFYLCFVVLEEIERLQIHHISLLSQKVKYDRSDLNSVAVHCSRTTGHQGPERDVLRPAKQLKVAIVSAALRPTFWWSLIASEPRGRPYILGNRYEHLIRWKSNSNYKVVTTKYPGPTSSNLDQWISRSKNYNCPLHIATYSPVHHKNKAFGRKSTDKTDSLVNQP